MGGKVTVACKMPNGLMLRVFNEVEVSVPLFGGGTKTVKEYQEVEGAPRVQIKGTAVAFGQTPRAAMAGGYALTPNVDAEFWEQWLAQNRTSDMVRNNLIFATKQPAQARDKAKEQAGIKSGLEPLNPAMKQKGERMVPVDPRYPRAANPNISEIEPDKERGERV